MVNSSIICVERKNLVEKVLSHVNFGVPIIVYVNRMAVYLSIDLCMPLMM
jgi:hypothetical protein